MNSIQLHPLFCKVNWQVVFNINKQTNTRMDPGPSRHYSTEDVLDLVMEDEEPGPPSSEYDPEEIDEPIFLGSDDESGLFEEEEEDETGFCSDDERLVNTVLICVS